VQLPRRVRVYLVDDHEIVRRGLRGFLETAADIEVVGEADDGRRAIPDLEHAALSGCPADVVLLDLVMQSIGGFDVAHHLRQLAPAPKVVILSAYGDVDRVRRALRLDVAGYVMKSSRPDHILEAIQAAYRGATYIDPTIAGKLARATADQGPDAPPLTRREREVIELVAQGKSNIDIASALFISERTARTHVSHILSKLRLDSRVQLALWAVDHGVTRGTRTAE